MGAEGSGDDVDDGADADDGDDRDADPLAPAVEVRVATGTARVDDLEAFLAALERVGDEHGCTVQAFDARYVASREHLRRAVALADRAIDRGENVARERSVEVLLYAAGRRQIDDALAMGVGEGERAVAVVVAADPGAGTDPGENTDPDSDGDGDPAGVAADPAGAVRALGTLGALEAFDPGRVDPGDPDAIAEFFGITDRELAATDATLADLVLERVAMLEVEK